MKVINTIIVTTVFMFQSSYGFSYYNTLFCNNHWVPENKDEHLGYEEHIQKINEQIPKKEDCKRKIKYIPNNENINFNQDGEISMLE